MYQTQSQKDFSLINQEISPCSYKIIFLLSTLITFVYLSFNTIRSKFYNNTEEEETISLRNYYY